LVLVILIRMVTYKISITVTFTLAVLEMCSVIICTTVLLFYID